MSQINILSAKYIQWHRVMHQYEHGTPYSKQETEGLGLTTYTHPHA